MRIFAGDRVRAIMDRLKMPDGEAIEAGIVTRSIESAQRKVEARNFDIRKQLLEYDDVANDQRKVIYQQRNEILEADLLDRADRQPAQGHDDRGGAHLGAGRQRRGAVGPAGSRRRCARSGSSRSLAPRWRRATASPTTTSSRRWSPPPTPSSTTSWSASARAVHALHAHGAAAVHRHHWREHLPALDYLRQGIHLRGYAQKNPKQEYKREAFELFSQLLDLGEDGSDARDDDGAHPVAGGGAGRRGDRGAPERISNVTYTHPNEDGRSPRKPTRPDARGGAGAQGGPQRPCPCGSGKSTSSATASWPEADREKRPIMPVNPST